MKKLSLVFALPAVSLCAQESGPQNVALNSEVVVSAAKTFENGLSDFVAALVPFVISLILSALVVVLIYKVTSWLVDAYDKRKGTY